MSRKKTLCSFRRLKFLLYLCTLIIKGKKQDRKSMIEIKIADAQLAQAAEQGIDEFLAAIIRATKQAIGGELTAANMQQLSTSQITLLAFDILHEEVMDGGFIQLIHNGYGGFIFLNPVAKVLKDWGLKDLSKLLFAGKKLYFDNRKALEKDCSDEEFMALYEQHPDFDDLDDEFVANEEQWTSDLAMYVDEHLSDFVSVTA